MASPALMHTANMKHNIRLVAVDMDGTLLRRDKTIGERTVRAVNTALACGKEVLIATGRSRVQCERYLEHFPQMRYVITSSGAAVYDVQRGWEKIISNEIPVEIVIAILQYAESVDCFPILSVGGKSVYVRGKADLAAEYGLAAYVYEMRTFGTAVDSVFDWYSSDPRPAESVSLYFRDEKLRYDAVEALGEYPLYFALPGEPAVEISLNTANKGYALQTLCDLLGIEIVCAAAIGDSDNDLPMLTAAGLSIASGNAPYAVQSLCDYVVADCNHDGVAEALERFILN